MPSRPFLYSISIATSRSCDQSFALAITFHVPALGLTYAPIVVLLSGVVKTAAWLRVVSCVMQLKFKSEPTCSPRIRRCTWLMATNWSLRYCTWVHPPGSQGYCNIAKVVPCVIPCCFWAINCVSNIAPVLETRWYVNWDLFNVFHDAAIMSLKPCICTVTSQCDICGLSKTHFELTIELCALREVFRIIPSCISCALPCNNIPCGLRKSVSYVMTCCGFTTLSLAVMASFFSYYCRRRRLMSSSVSSGRSASTFIRANGLF